MSDLRRIWLCADDYGLSPGVNAAIRDLLERGRINATSVMTVTPAFTREEISSLVVGLMVIGGVQLIMIGVMGEYIGKILSEQKARPVYFVAEHHERSAQSDQIEKAGSDARPTAAE